MGRQLLWAATDGCFFPHNSLLLHISRTKQNDWHSFTSPGNTVTRLSWWCRNRCSFHIPALPPHPSFLIHFELPIFPIIHISVLIIGRVCFLLLATKLSDILHLLLFFCYKTRVSFSQKDIDCCAFKRPYYWASKLLVGYFLFPSFPSFLSSFLSFVILNTYTFIYLW